MVPYRARYLASARAHHFVRPLATVKADFAFEHVRENVMILWSNRPALYTITMSIVYVAINVRDL